MLCCCVCCDYKGIAYVPSSLEKKVIYSLRVE